MTGVIELARLQMREGKGDAMERRARAAVDELKGAEGALRVSAYRGVEQPDTFVFEIEWRSIDAHLAYRDTPGFAAYKEQIGDLVAAGSAFAHYRLVAD